MFRHLCLAVSILVTLVTSSHAQGYVQLLASLQVANLHSTLPHEQVLADCDRLKMLVDQAQQTIYDADPEQEVKFRREALALLEKHFGKSHWWTQIEKQNVRSAERASKLKEDADFQAGRAKLAAGVEYMRRHHVGDAITELQVALRLLIACTDPHDAVALDCKMNLATCLARQEQYEASAEQYAEAIVLLKAIYGDQHPYVAIAIGNLGHLDANRENYPAAIAHLQSAGRILIVRQMADAEDAIRLKAVLANSLVQVDRIDDAREAASAALAMARIGEFSSASKTNYMLGCYYVLGQCDVAQEKPQAAVSLLAPVVESLEQKSTSGVFHLRVLTIYAEALKRCGYSEEEQEVAERIRLLERK